MNQETLIVKIAVSIFEKLFSTIIYYLKLHKIVLTKNFIKACILQILIVLLYFINPHDYVEANELLKMFGNFFLINFLVLNSLSILFYLVDKLCEKFNKKDHITNYISRFIICILCFYLLNFINHKFPYRVFEEDVVVTNGKGENYKLKKNTIFDFEYLDGKSGENNSELSYQVENVKYTLKACSKIKLFQGTKLYLTNEKELTLNYNKKTITNAIILSNNESYGELKIDGYFYLTENALVTLRKTSDITDLIENLLFIWGFIYLCLIFMSFIYFQIMKKTEEHENCIIRIFNLLK